MRTTDVGHHPWRSSVIALGIFFDIATLVIAIAVLIIVVYLVIRRQFKSFDVRMGTMSATLTGIETSVEQVNTAVNNVPDGAPTLIHRVQCTEEKIELMEEHQHWERHALQALASHVGAVLPEGNKA